MKSSIKRNPVLLIHGMGDTRAIFKKMTAYLVRLGWDVHSIDLIPNNGVQGLDILAKQVASYVDKIFGQKQPFDLVGFSMGGIVSRYYVQRMGGINRVQRLITIASPHQGTKTGYLTQHPGGVQMRPGSAFLEDLNGDMAMLEKINFTSIWTPFDLMIVPANSSSLPIGKEIVIPVVLHPWMVTDPKAIKAIAQALATPLKYDA